MFAVFSTCIWRTSIFPKLCILGKSVANKSFSKLNSKKLLYSTLFSRTHCFSSHHFCVNINCTYPMCATRETHLKKWGARPPGPPSPLARGAGPPVFQMGFGNNLFYIFVVKSLKSQKNIRSNFSHMGAGQG